MAQSEGNSCFDSQMERIKLVTGKRTQVGLAEFLGIRQSSVSDAKRRGKIPSSWLVILTRTKNVSPEWVLTGNGPCFIGHPPKRPGVYETGDEFAERMAEQGVLQQLSSRALAEELLRRIAVSQNEVFCTEKEEAKE